MWTCQIFPAAISYFLEKTIMQFTRKIGIVKLMSEVTKTGI